MAAPILRVFIVRHGETEENKDGTIQGQLDTELNEEGLRQAALLAERMKGIPLRIAFSSDLKRARKTAEVVLESHPGVELKDCVELRERFMGSLQGLKLPGIARRAMMQEDKSIETTEQLAARSLRWWKTSILPLAKEHLRASAEDGEGALNVLATSHGGTISTFFAAALSQGLLVRGDGVEFTRCWNTSVSVVEVDCKTLKGTVVMYADISHLLSKAVVETNADEVEAGEKDAATAVNVVWVAEPHDSRPQSRNV